MPGRLAAQTPATIRVGATTNDVAQAVYYADALGYFKKAGLDVQIQTMGSGAAELAAVAGGGIDIGESNVLSLAVAHSRGIPVKFIAPAGEYVSATPTTLLVVEKNSPIRSGKDLNGKTIATSALHDLLQIATAEWVDKNGGDSKTVKFIEMPSPEMAPALVRGTVDAATIPEPSLTVARETTRVLGKPYDAVASRFIIDAWFARNEWIEQNRDVAKRFADAVVEASIWGNKNHAASAKILEQHSKIDPSVIAAMTRATYGQRLSTDNLQPVIALAARYDAIPQAFPATDIYDAAL